MVRESEYIMAARMLGFSHARIILRHVLPNAITPLTEGEIGRAESTRAGLALLLVSPEFLRR